MRIAVNTRFLLSHKMEGFGWYTYEIVKRLVELHPEDEFIFFFDRPFDNKFVFGPNVTPVVLKPQARHPFLFVMWFEFAVFKALKKYKADVFFSPDGYLSLRSDVPQVGVIHDINFEHNPQDLPWLMRKYYRRFFPKFAVKASSIITVSEYSANDIASTYGIEREKINVIWNSASDLFKPLDENTKQITREKFTGGKPYFIFVGALHPRKNVKRMLEAFFRLKEQTETNIQFLIVGTELWSNATKNLSIPEAFKENIHFTGHLNLEDLALVMGAAHALVFVPYFEGFGIPLVEAMRCGIPIIAGNLTSLPEVAGEAAIYCDPYSVDAIYMRMKELSESDELSISLSAKGIERSKQFSWDQSAENVYTIIKDTVDHAKQH